MVFHSTMRVSILIVTATGTLSPGEVGMYGYDPEVQGFRLFSINGYNCDVYSLRFLPLGCNEQSISQT